jgi:hypothetical protein
LLIVLGARPSANASGSTAGVSFTVPLSGEVRVTPPAPRPVLVAGRLKASGPRASGRFEVQNQTGRTLGLRFRAIRSSSGLDRFLRVRLSASGRLLANTTLGDLRHASRPLRLPPGVNRMIGVRAWIPANVSDGYEGQQVDVSLVTTATRG